ncbi:transcription factor TGA7 [Citrus sinensis]|nr:transcription factor TGA7 [Citrus sinensis]
MSSPSSQLATLRRMSIYEPFHQISMWGDTFHGDASPNTGSSTIVQVDTRLDNQTEYLSHNSVEPSRSDQEANKPSEKTQRRLAQNREAARKSRLRKKAYVQQLESSRLKLAQLEQELDRARRQGIYTGSTSDGSHFGLSGNINPGITAFEMEYSHWVEEQNRQIYELRNALQKHITDIELRILVENGLNHYNNLFRMKADAAKADVLSLISGMWRTSTERFFQWIGGFRPSELLNILMPQLEPLTEQQLIDVCNLRQSSQQAEDALQQGIDKLQQSLVQIITEDQSSSEIYQSQMVAAAEKLEALESFVNQTEKTYAFHCNFLAANIFFGCSRKCNTGLMFPLVNLLNLFGKITLNHMLTLLSINVDFCALKKFCAFFQFLSSSLNYFALPCTKQADHLRQQTMQQMYRVLTTRQAARALLALGEYFHRLRALSSLWAAQHLESA